MLGLHICSLLNWRESRARMNILDTTRINHSLRRRYILALSIIALLVIISQGLVQYVLIDQEDDSRIVNIAGRQRMLSQRIAKCSLILHSTLPDAEKQPFRDELGMALRIWIQSHAGLQRGDAEMGLPGKNSAQVTNMFQQIEPHFQDIVMAAELIVADGAGGVNTQAALRVILKNQAEFLQGMDKIVFQYDAEAKQKITSIKQIEIGILLITFLALLLEALFIFRPAEKQIQNTFNEYLTAEKLLTEKEQFQRMLLTNVAAGIMVVDEHTRCIEMINSMGAELFGESTENILGKVCHQFVCPAQEGMCPISDLRQQVEKSERKLVRACGDTIPILKSVKRITLGDGPKLLEVFVDISRQKAAEEEIREREERYHRLMALSFDAICLIDPENMEIIEVNDRFTEWFGFALPEDAPLMVSQMVLESPMQFEPIRQRLISGQTIIPEFRSFRCKNGTVKTVERVASPIRLGGKELLYIAMRDVTQERKMEKTLRREVEFAGRMQYELLPRTESAETLAIRTIYLPAAIVSGDTYHLEWNRGKTVLQGFLLDVTGHGLGTAVQTAAIQVLLKRMYELNVPLEEKLAWLDKESERYFEEASFAAGIAFELDTKAKQLRYVGAGITEFWANRQRVIVPGSFLGIGLHQDHEIQVRSVGEGDLLVFPTDGLTDVFSALDELPLEAGIDAVMSYLEDFLAGAEHKDDVTVIVLHMR